MNYLAIDFEPDDEGIAFGPDPAALYKMGLTETGHEYPAEVEIARLRRLLDGQADWWSREYERVCAENRRLRDLLADHGAN